MWFTIAAGVGLTAILPQTRNQVKDVPWMPTALAVGLGFLSDSINNVTKTKSIGTASMSHFENGTTSKGVTVVKRRHRIYWGNALQQDATRTAD